MKTFRWTVPELPLSPAEKRQHELARKNRGLPKPLPEKPLVAFKGRNYMERRVIDSINSDPSLWSLLPAYANGILITLIFSGGEKQEYVWFFWGLIALLTFHHFYQRATGRIIATLEENQTPTTSSSLTPPSESSASPSTEATESTLHSR